MKARHILIIVNPHAGGGKAKPVIDLFQEHLDKHEIQYHVYYTLESNNKPHVHKLMELYNFDVVSVIGGDGTINQALNAIPDLSITLHLIPAGTGNDLAKMLFSEENTALRFDQILDLNSKKKMDVWRVNDKRFTNGFGVGFDGAIAHAMSGKTYVAQKLKYWFEILKIIAGYNSYEMDIDGVKQKTFMMSAANGRVYGGSFNVAPQAEIDDGLLDIVSIRKVSKLLRFLYLPKVQKGTHLELDVVDFSRTDAITIRSEHAMQAHIDGEILEDSHYVIRHDGQISVLA